jgi:hypothetical protein
MEISPSLVSQKAPDALAMTVLHDQISRKLVVENVDFVPPLLAFLGRDRSELNHLLRKTVWDAMKPGLFHVEGLRIVHNQENGWLLLSQLQRCQ